MPTENKPLAVYASFSTTGIKTRVLNETLTSALVADQDAVDGALEVMQRAYPCPVRSWRLRMKREGYSDEEIRKMTPPEDYVAVKAKVDAVKEPMSYCVWMRNNVHNVMTSPTKMRNQRILPVALMAAHDRNLADANKRLQDELIPNAIENLEEANGWAEIAAGSSKLRKENLATEAQLRAIRIDYQPYRPMINPDQFIKDIATSLSADRVEEVKRQLETSHREEMRIAEQDMLAQMSERTTALAESLSGGGNIIAKTVEKLVEMAEFTLAKNIGGNNTIRQACENVTQLLGHRLPDGTWQLAPGLLARIRSDSSFRGQVSESLSNIAEFTLGSRKL